MNDAVIVDGADDSGFDLSLPVAVVFALIPFDRPPPPDPDRDAAAVFWDTF